MFISDKYEAELSHFITWCWKIISEKFVFAKKWDRKIQRTKNQIGLKSLKNVIDWLIVV
jgi:hypothetical protein